MERKIVKVQGGLLARMAVSKTQNGGTQFQAAKVCQ